MVLLNENKEVQMRVWGNSESGQKKREGYKIE